MNAVSLQTGTADVYRLLREQKKTHQATWKEKNILSLQKFSGSIKVKGNIAFLEEPGKPRVDFALTTGRWTVKGEATVYGGGAEAFLRWYRQRSLG